MKVKDKKIERRLKVRKRIRKRVHGTLAQPRLSLKEKTKKKQKK